MISFLTSIAPVAISLSLLVVTAGCGSPSPKAEEERLTVISNSTKVAIEGVPFNFALAPDMKDPEYKADRLNPDRYKVGELVFKCLSGCSESMALDSATGVLKWTPGFADQGLHFVNFSVSASDYYSTTVVQILVADAANANSVVIPTSPLKAKEGERFVMPLSVSPSEGVSTRLFLTNAETYGAVIVQNDPTDPSVGFRSTRLDILSAEPASTVSSNEFSLTWEVPYDAPRSVQFDIGVEESRRERPMKIFGEVPADVDVQKLWNEIAPLVYPDSEKPKLAVSSVKIDVENTDQLPLISNVVFSINEGEASRLFLNANDPDGDAFIILGQNLPSGAVLSNDGFLSWTPDYVSAGIYKPILSLVQKSVVVKTIEITIEVLNVNRPPVFTSLLSELEVNEGATATFELNARDLDVDDTLTFSILSGAVPSIFINPTSGQVTYSPSFEEAGNRSFTFNVSDGKASVSKTILVLVHNVNRAPSFTLPSTVPTANAWTISAIQVAASDPDVEDSGLLRFRCILDCPIGFTLDSSTGIISFKPTYAMHGPYIPLLAVSDGRLEVSIRFPIEVLRIDQPPSFLTNGPFRLMEDTPFTTVINAKDNDNDVVTYSCIRGCPPGLTIDPVSGSLSWTPGLDDAKTWVITLGASSSPAWDPLTVRTTELAANFIVTNFNRTPVCSSAVVSGLCSLAQTNYSVYENGHASADQFSPNTAALSLTLPITDPDHDPLRLVCDGDCPAPADMRYDALTNTVKISPSYATSKVSLNKVYSGFKLGLTDGGFTIFAEPMTLTVLDVNRAPSVSSITDRELDEGVMVRISIGANDPDGNETLTYSCVSNCPRADEYTFVQASGEFLYTPRFDTVAYNPTTLSTPAYKDLEDVVIAVNDGAVTVTTAPFRIRVRNVNQAPQLVGNVSAPASINERNHSSSTYDVTTIGSPLLFKFNAVDPDNEPLAFTVECSYATGTVCPRSVADVVGQPPNPNASMSVSTSGDVTWSPGYLTVQPSPTSDNFVDVGYRIYARDPSGATVGPIDFVTKLVNVD
ncbi:MAG: hypothetical protein EOP06_01960, partial [Proteobacteria bacterium]